MGKLQMVSELWLFIRRRKKWWLLPMLFVLVLLGILVLFAETSALAPFIYSLF